MSHGAFFNRKDAIAWAEREQALDRERMMRVENIHPDAKRWRYLPSRFESTFRDDTEFSRLA